MGYEIIMIDVFILEVTSGGGGGVSVTYDGCYTEAHFTKVPSYEQTPAVTFSADECAATCSAYPYVVLEVY